MELFRKVFQTVLTTLFLPVITVDSPPTETKIITQLENGDHTDWYCPYVGMVKRVGHITGCNGKETIALFNFEIPRRSKPK